MQNTITAPFEGARPLLTITTLALRRELVDLRGLSGGPEEGALRRTTVKPLDGHSKGLIRGLMYPVIFASDPVDAVERVLDTVVRARALDASPEEYASAVDAALQSDEPLSELLPQPHSDATIRAFLAALRPHLPASPAGGTMAVKSSFRDRLAPGGTKRLLTFDGGGIRGLIALEIAGRLESLLRDALGAGEDFVLADYFDYIAGTSTGAIIATCLSLGYSVDKVRRFYFEGAAAMFRRAPLLKQFYYRNVGTNLTARLQEVLRGADGSELTLGADALRTLLLVIMKNASTNSPWPLSNNPAALYNDRALPGCNLELPLWKIVRASTAAPTFFPPEDVTVGGERFVFVDGAVSVYNNPAFLLFLMATLPQYRLGWPTGEEKMLLISVGTGAISGASPTLKGSQMSLLYNVRSVPLALLDASQNEQDVLCRIFGRCRHGEPIDTEVGDFIESDEAYARDGGPFAPKKFTYMRYNPDIGPEGLAALGLSNVRSDHVQLMDSPNHLDELVAVGKAYANRLDLAQFGAFPLGTVRGR